MRKKGKRFIHQRLVFVGFGENDMKTKVMRFVGLFLQPLPPLYPPVRSTGVKIVVQTFTSYPLVKFLPQFLLHNYII